MANYSCGIVIFIFAAAFCGQYCLADDAVVLITVKNYLDIPVEQNVTVTVTDKITNESYTFIPIQYSNEACRQLTDGMRNQKVFYWKVSWSIVVDKRFPLSYNLSSPIAMEFGDEPSNITITLYGPPDTFNADLRLETKSTSHSSLGIDEAHIGFINMYPYPIEYSELSSNCYKCLSKVIGTIIPGDSVPVIVSTQFMMTYSFRFVTTNVTVCSPVSYHFKEHNYYDFVLGHNSSMSDVCILLKVIQVDEPPNTYMPLLYVGIVLLGSFLIWTIGTQGYLRLKKKGCLHLRRIDRNFSHDMGDPDAVKNDYGAVNEAEKDKLLASSTENTAQVAPKNSSAKKRLKSLDTVRGLSLMIMIFVNYGGGGYWFFSHSKWNGVTVADLVFPWFVWIMGVSIVFSFRGRRKSSILSCLYQIIRRTIILMSLGLFLNNDVLAVPWFVWQVGLSITVPLKLLNQTSYRCYKTSVIILWVGIWYSYGFDLSTWRIPGVLQRFAASYFVVALTEMLSVPVYAKLNIKFPKSEYFQDLLKNWIQWLIMFLLEILWLSITFGLGVPGCPRGYLGPGGLSEEGKYSNCTGGAAGYIDRLLLTDTHVYHSPTCKKLYDTGPYDPEGILGTLNSIVICFLGVQAGRIIVCYQSHGHRLLRFVIWAVVLGGIAAALCEGKKDDGLMPLNKNLWSLSFILAMAGLGFILLSLFYILIDVLEVWNGAPFIYPGMNSILVYVGSELLEGMFPFGWKGMENSHLEFLASNVVSVLLWALVAYYWYAIEFFIKI